jgi:hypothetical protein
MSRPGTRPTRLRPILVEMYGCHSPSNLRPVRPRRDPSARARGGGWRPRGGTEDRQDASWRQARTG